MLKVSSHIKSNIEGENDYENDLNDFKGIYYNDNEEEKYYEGGAHFKYRDLCNRLEKIVLSLAPDRRGKSMYEDWDDSKDNKMRRSHEKIDYSSYAKTNANSRKFASDNSRETLLEKNSSSKLKEFFGKPETSTGLTISNINIKDIYGLKQNPQSRNNSLNMNSNLGKNSYAYESYSKNHNNVKESRQTNKQLNNISQNMMKTYTHIQHSNKSTTTNPDNLNTNKKNNSLNSKNIKTVNKVQPKIIKSQNPFNKKFISNSKKLARVSNNYSNERDFLKQGDYTKVNGSNNITRTKILNSSMLNNSNLMHSKEVLTNIKLNSHNLNQNISNSHSRNYNKSEISALSDLASSVNNINSRQSTKRKSANLINRPNVNMTFVNNINNFMASVDSITKTTNITNLSVINNYNGKSNVFMNLIKKSRNEKNISDLNNRTTFSNNTPNVSIFNKNIQLNNFRTMMSGRSGHENMSNKSRNNKHYSGNFETLSRGNTFDKNKNSPIPNKITHKDHNLHIPNHTIDNKPLDGHHDKTTNINIESNNYHDISSEKKSHQYSKNSTNLNNSMNKNNTNSNHSINTKDKEISVLSSNYLYLKQKINNLKISFRNGSNGKNIPPYGKKPINNFISFNNRDNSKPNKFLYGAANYKNQNSIIPNDHPINSNNNKNINNNVKESNQFRNNILKNLKIVNGK